jgi:hypothetical protein
MTVLRETQSSIKQVAQSDLISLANAANIMISPARQYPPLPDDRSSDAQKESRALSLLQHCLSVLAYKMVVARIVSPYLAEVKRLMRQVTDEFGQANLVQDLFRQAGIPDEDLISVSHDAMAIVRHGYYGALATHLSGVGRPLRNIRERELDKYEGQVRSGKMNASDIESPLLAEMADPDIDLMRNIAINSTASLDTMVSENHTLTMNEFFGYSDALDGVFEIMNSTLSSDNNGQANALVANLFSLVQRRWDLLRTDYDAEQEKINQTTGLLAMPNTELRNKVGRNINRLLTVSWADYDKIDEMQADDWRFTTLRQILALDDEFESELRSLEAMPRETQVQKESFEARLNELGARPISSFISTLTYANADFLVQLFDAYLSAKLPESANYEVRRLAIIIEKMIANKIMHKPESGVIATVFDFVGVSLRGKAAKVAAA